MEVRSCDDRLKPPSPFTPCIAGGTRATAQSVTVWAAMCGTAERPSRLGWNSRSTNVGNCGALVSERSTNALDRAMAVRAGD